MSQNSKIHDDTIDLKELLFSLISQWKIIFICILISLIYALIYLRVTPNIYSTDALVQVEDSRSAASKALLGELGDLSGAVSQKSPADAEIEILNSRLVLGNVIENLNLNIQIKDTKDTLVNRLFNHLAAQVNYSSKGLEYKTAQGAFFIEKFIVPDYYLDKNLILKLNEQNQQFYLTYKDQKVLSGTLNKENVITDAKGTWIVKINSKSSFDQEFVITKLTLPSAIKSISQNYGVKEKGKMTGVIGLTYQGEDPAHITQVLNNILKVYHAQNIERKSLESQQTLSFLDKQLPELKKQVEESEVKFNKFREQYNTVDITQESELLLKQNVALETTKIELKQKQAEFAAKYTNDHPLMAEINAQLDAVNKKSAELNATIKRLPELQRQYLQLYGDVKVNTELYTSLLNNYQQLKVANAGEIGNVRVIDTAIEPVKPIQPKKLMILILSIFIGGFIGILLALLRNMMQSGIKDASQIEDEFNISVYATVPRSELQLRRTTLLKKKRQLPILAAKDSEDGAVESLRSLRTAIYFALGKEHGNQVILISGTSHEIGKSFISINLATILAQSGKRVLLIDADMRRGYLQQYFTTANNLGLSNLLTDNISELHQAIQNTDIENLAFLARGKSTKNPAELLNNGKFAAIIEQLKQQYDHIVIDTPPLLAVTDAAIISHSVDLNLLVVRFAKSHLKEVDITINRFKQSGREVHGVILNDIHKTNGAYGYGYDYQYSYDYKSRK